MSEHIEKSKDNKKSVLSKTVAQKNESGKQGIGFVDNRPAAVAQRKLQETANNYSGQQTHPLQNKTKNTGLPHKLKSGIENLSGYSMDDVQVHYNSNKPAQFQAHAYAQGANIHLGPGQEKHLPHEAWHVVQQKRGSVKPTLQMNGGANVNDDAELENEADLMGGKALQRQGIDSNASALKTKTPNSAQAIQRIISVATFQANTPKTFGHNRGPNILAVDADLATYIGARTHMHAVALNTRCGNYLGGNHQAARMAAVTALRIEIQRERDLLIHIGDANAHLIDALITQMGGAPGMPQLLNLAAQVGQANANALPNLINTVTPAHVGALVASGIIPLMGGADAYLLNQLIPLAGGMGGMGALTALVTAAAPNNLDLLPSMVRNSGGAARIGELTALINRGGKTTADIFDLAREAGGNAADFLRFHNDVLACTSTPAPAMPGAVTVARNAYNLAKNTHFDAADNAVIGNILPDVTTMRGAATQVQTAAIAMGAPGGLMGVLALLIIDINTHVAGLGAGLPLPFTFQDVRNNINTLDTRLNHLRGWANAQPPSPERTTILNQHPLFTAARGTFNTVPFPVAVRPRDVGQIDYAHFFQRHTRTHFDFTDIKPQNTMWPIAWDPAPNNNVSASIINGFNVLAGANQWFMGSIAQNGVATGLAPTMRMVAYNMGDGTLRLGMVFPEANPGAGVYDYTGNQMRAIFKAI